MQEALDEVSLLDAGVRADPYRFYHRLRSEYPVYWSKDWGGWLLTRYKDVASALQAPRLSLEGGVAVMFERLAEPEQQELLPLRRHVSMWLGARDVANHNRLRSVMHKAFTPRLLDELGECAQEAAKQLIDEAQGRGRMDVVRDFASPLAATVIAWMLGAPMEDRERFIKCSNDITTFVAYGLLVTEHMRRAQQSILEMMAYLKNVAGRNRNNGRCGNLVNTLLDAGSQAREAGEDEILANCVLLIFAGHETTSILIGNSILALLQNPDQMEKLRRTPALITSAVDEFLRYDSPVQMVRRLVVEDLEIGGQPIRKGQLVWPVLGAANRDPTQFSAPDNLDIARRENRHLAFGCGVHFCLGARLSCLEGQIAITTLLDRLPNLRLETSNVEWQDNPTARALKSLPVAF